MSWRDGHALNGARVLAEETAVAISYNGSTHAVLMSTPADLEDLAVGFSITEGIVGSISGIEQIGVVDHELGLEVQVRVRDDVAERLAARRRSMAGPVGCGMCGLESLEAATRDLPSVQVAMMFASSDIVAAVQSIERLQDLNGRTGAAHAAGFFVPGAPVELVREDVGRHNALDKLIGALLRTGVAPSGGGMVVTSRVSVELVQKAAVAGCGLLAAISAPTAFAVRAAQAADITLAAVVRGGSFEVFSRPDRVQTGVVADVA
ncbi:MAG: formate dehydrogenase accessory sulfurtransferase FdhD [Hyphomicrobiaceae bacterium]